MLRGTQHRSQQINSPAAEKCHQMLQKKLQKIKGKQTFINNGNLERKVGIYWFQNFFFVKIYDSIKLKLVHFFVF